MANIDTALYLKLSIVKVKYYLNYYYYRILKLPYFNYILVMSALQLSQLSIGTAALPFNSIELLHFLLNVRLLWQIVSYCSVIRHNNNNNNNTSNTQCNAIGAT